MHNKYGLFPSEKVNVVLKSEIPIKNPSVNYKYLKDTLNLVPTSLPLPHPTPTI